MAVIPPPMPAGLGLIPPLNPLVSAYNALVQNIPNNAGFAQQLQALSQSKKATTSAISENTKALGKMIANLGSVCSFFIYLITNEFKTTDTSMYYGSVCAFVSVALHCYEYWFTYYGHIYVAYNYFNGLLTLVLFVMNFTVNDPGTTLWILGCVLSNFFVDAYKLKYRSISREALSYWVRSNNVNLGVITLQELKDSGCYVYDDIRDVDMELLMGSVAFEHFGSIANIQNASIAARATFFTDLISISNHADICFKEDNHCFIRFRQ